MSLTYGLPVKTARMTATRDHFANGTLEIGTLNMGTVLATFTLSASGGTVTNDKWTLGFVNTTVSTSAAGIAANARLKTSGGSVDISGLTVGVSCDIVIDTTSLKSGQNVTVTSATITHAL